jgi:hypothetical protein
MGGTTHDTKKQDTNTTRHDGGPCLGRDLGTQCRHEHDTKNEAVHLNTTNLEVSIRL